MRYDSRALAPASFASVVVSPRNPTRSLFFLFVSLIFLGGLIMRLPICTQGEPLSWTAAYFTATSAICVTGLSVFDVQSTLSTFGQVVLMLMIQIGGLGYMLASTFLLLFFGREPRLHEKLLLRSTIGQITLRDTVSLVLRAVVFTLVVEGIGAIILATRFAMLPEFTIPRAIWYGVFHSISAFCSGGFDLFGVSPDGRASLALFRDDWVINLVVPFLVIIGGLGFAVYHEFLSHWRDREMRTRQFSLHTRIVLWMTFWLLVVGTVAILVTEWTNVTTLGPLPLHEKVMSAFFQSMTLRSSGLSTLDFGALRSITLLICGIWMFIGAAPGGTSGGIKVTTFATTLVAVRSTLRGQADAEILNRRIATETVYRALVLIFISFAVLVAGIFVLTFTEPVAIRESGIDERLFMRIQFEALSAFGTVGLSTGITPFITDSGRVVLMLLMFLGRLGPITAATALSVRAATPRRRLPEEEVALG